MGNPDLTTVRPPLRRPLFPPPARPPSAEGATESTPTVLVEGSDQGWVPLRCDPFPRKGSPASLVPGPTPLARSALHPTGSGSRSPRIRRIVSRRSVPRGAGRMAGGGGWSSGTTGSRHPAGDPRLSIPSQWSLPPAFHLTRGPGIRPGTDRPIPLSPPPQPPPIPVPFPKAPPTVACPPPPWPGCEGWPRSFGRGLPGNRGPPPPGGFLNLAAFPASISGPSPP